MPRTKITIHTYILMLLSIMQCMAVAAEPANIEASKQKAEKAHIVGKFIQRFKKPVIIMGVTALLVGFYLVSLQDEQNVDMQKIEPQHQEPENEEIDYSRPQEYNGPEDDVMA